MAVSNKGKPAVTHYRIERRYDFHTLLRVRLETGRTHQIRVHFKHIGFPLAGDGLYGKKATAQLASDTGVRTDRQMLHAQSLAFTHPRSGKRLEIEATWPSDFDQAVAALRKAQTK